MSFELLSEPIKRFVRDKGWTEFRPIQSAAISRILSTDSNYILASRTASGKTEAAFLPILSMLDFNEVGVQVLYISPLIALINDQFERVEELCKYLDVTITKWHGEANRAAKKKLINDPNGVLLITPESIEAMFINRPAEVRRLFTRLKFVVLDEVHSFTGSSRGVQLQSLLSRLQNVCGNAFRVIGLSATIGDYVKVKEITGNAANTKVLLDKTPKAADCEFAYFKNDGVGVSLDLLKDLYLTVSSEKALIFPNSRGLVEELAVKLKKLSNKVGGHANYFAHHSSVDKELREYIEQFAKTSSSQKFSIACTSTLELGIDIGSVDIVVQIDATNSIASLIQRLGRSGRKEGKKSKLLLYSTKPWSLLQSLACWLLYNENFIEPQEIIYKPFDIMVHQALSIVKSTSGIRMSDLVVQLKSNAAFRRIDVEDISEILMHLVACDVLEVIQDEFIIGVDGERIVNGREFYSVFITEVSYRVIHSGNNIGQIPLGINVAVGENIFLAASIWKIMHIDDKSKRIEVTKANDGKPPRFSGGIGDTHERIYQKMFEVLYSEDRYPFLNEQCSEVVRELRGEFSAYNINDLTNERPLFFSSKGVKIYTFASSKVNRTLCLLIQAIGYECIINNSSSSLEVTGEDIDFYAIWEKLPSLLPSIDKLIYENLIEKPYVIESYKWGYLLPIEYQTKLLEANLYDISGTQTILGLKFICNNS